MADLYGDMSAEGASSPNLASTLLQVVPLHVTDGDRTANLILDQPEAIKRFLNAPDELINEISDLDVSRAGVALSSFFQASKSIPVTSSPVELRLSKSAITKLLSERGFLHEGLVWKGHFSESTIKKLIRLHPTVLIATNEQRLGLFKIIPESGSVRTYADAPRLDEILVRRSDLTKFITNPSVPGTRNRPYLLNLTESHYRDLLEMGSTSLSLQDGRSFGVVVVSDDLQEAKSGLTFRREFWVPVSENSSFHVVSNQLVAESNAGMKAAQRFRDELLNRMRDNLNSGWALPRSNMHGVIVVLVPWRQTWSQRSFGLGPPRATLGLSPSESITFRNEDSINHAEKKSNRVDPDISISRDRRFDCSIISRTLALQADPAESARANQKILSEFQWHACSLLMQMSRRRLGTNEVNPSLDRTVSNTSDDSVLELEFHAPIVGYDIATFSLTQHARLGVLVQNPVYTSSMDATFIRRHASAIRDALLKPDLAVALDALGDVVMPMTTPSSDNSANGKERPQRTYDDEEEAGEAETSRWRLRKKKGRARSSEAGKERVTSDAGFARERELEAALIANCRDSLVSVREIAAELLSDKVTEAALRTVSVLSDENAAFVFGMKFGHPTSEDLELTRRWLARRVIEKSFPSLFRFLEQLINNETRSTSDASRLVFAWGERFNAALPTEFDLYTLVNINSSDRSLLREALAPLFRTFVSSDDAWESWFRKAEVLDMLRVSDLSLARSIERFMRHYDRVLQINRGCGGDSKISSQSGDGSRGVYKQIGELVAHVNEHRAHYAFAIFASMPRIDQHEIVGASLRQLMPQLAPEHYSVNLAGHARSCLIIELDHEAEPAWGDVLGLVRSQLGSVSLDGYEEVNGAGQTLRARRIAI